MVQLRSPRISKNRVGCVSTKSSSRSLLATASDKGTLLRIFSTHTGALQKELRRGVDRAVIFSLAFCPESRFLASASDKGTVHIFSIGAACNVSPPAYSDGRGASLPANARSNLSFLKKVIPGVASSYLESEWSFAQLRGLDGPAVCGFGAQPNTIVVVGGDGSFLTAGFGGGGDCGRISFAKFVRGEAEEADEAPPWPNAAPAAPTPAPAAAGAEAA